MQDPTTVSLSAVKRACFSAYHQAVLSILSCPDRKLTITGGRDMHVAIVAILLALAWTILEDRQGRQDDPEDFI